MCSSRLRLDDDFKIRTGHWWSFLPMRWAGQPWKFWQQSFSQMHQLQMLRVRSVYSEEIDFKGSDVG